MRFINKVCKNCKKEFNFDSWGGGTGQYCSTKCSSEGKRGKPSGALGKHWKLSLETRNRMSLAQKERFEDLDERAKLTEISRNIKHRKLTDVEKKNLSNIHKRLNSADRLPTLSGDSHWNWKGGITPEKTRCRKSYYYQKWRKAVFKRDNYTCQICGERGGYLEADHHPIPFCVLYKDSNYEVMWDISNGRTLCKSCHDSETKKLRKVLLNKEVFV